jgi:1,4-dihydroxy-2-naphthoyl-CoA hydrolase
MLAQQHGKTRKACMTPLERVRSFPLPFAELMGIKFVEADKDHVVATLVIREDLCTAGHSIHGGALMALADTVGAAATVVNLPADAKGTTTIESKTNFLSGAAAGTTITATATPVHRGRRTQVWQTRIESADKKLIALVTQTQMVL